MDKAFKHPQIFSDLLMFYKRYYPIHGGWPNLFDLLLALEYNCT